MDRSLRAVWACVALAIALGACRDEPARRTTASLSIRTSSGEVALDVEVADEDSERTTGLMGRERLAPYDGMAFVWEEPVETTFWMKDTLIPLSIAFWDERGRIISILDMELCRDDLCPLYGPDEPFVGAVEVARGELERRGVRVGDLVVLSS